MNRLGAYLDADALRALVTAADGYPFFLQAFDKANWDVSSTKTVNLDDARMAIEISTEQLDAAVFRAPLATGGPRRTPIPPPRGRGPRRSLIHSPSGIKNEQGSQPMTVARSNLIFKGLIYAPDHGAVLFTVPGMSGFISRQFEG